MLRHRRTRIAGLILVSAVFMFFLTPSFSQAGSTSYIYDDANRLNRAVNDSGEAATYNYDNVGNILSIDRATGGLPAPTITSVAPSSVEAGKSVTVTINGTHLKGTSLGINNPDVNISNLADADTVLTATVVAQPYAVVGNYVLTVANSLGTASDAFAVTQPVPVISSLDPSSGHVSRIVTITGTGFSAVPGGNVVTFNGSSATVLSSANTTIEAMVPAGASSGPVVVTVNGMASNGVALPLRGPPAR